MEGSRKALIAGLLAASAAACAPLEQAPLVYTSRHQIGVGVTAGTPENPGLDVQIGYKGLDAAFVPVMVSKPCVAGARCRKLDPNIIKIGGMNKILSQSLAERAQLESLRKQLVETAARRDAQTGSLATRRAQLEMLGQQDSLNALVQAIEKKPLTQPAPALLPDGTPAPAGPPVTLRTQAESEELEKAKARLREIAAIDQSKASIEAEIGKLEASTARLADEALAAQRSIEQLERVKNESADDTKEDALSVYGSFNGGANGNGKGASLTLGKVFSTGVAAQNLSQGIGAGARASATAECLTQAEKVFVTHQGNEADKAAFWRKLMLGCGVRGW